METLLEGLAETWGVLSGIVTLFVALWLVSKPSRWMEARKRRKEGPTETIFLDDKTLHGLEELDARTGEPAQTPERPPHEG